MLNGSLSSAGSRRPSARNSPIATPGRRCDERFEVTSDKNWIEAVKARRDRRMRGKKISCARRCQCNIERLARLLHEASSAFEDSECGVSFVQVADVSADF